MSSITHFDIWKDPNPEYRIKNLINELDYVKTTLEETTCENIVERLCKDGASYASILNANAPQSGVDKSVIETNIDDTVGRISLSGRNAIYDEFGTGEEGQSDPHPMKDYFELNPYNSGPYIFYNQLANRYQWWYKPMAGKPYFTDSGLTSGIPSGKQMYNTLNYIYEIRDNIVKEEINEALQVLK